VRHLEKVTTGLVKNCNFENKKQETQKMRKIIGVLFFLSVLGAMPIVVFG
jgi:hypothetical protein